MTYKHIAEIEFNGEFPLDMLRYDRCSPDTQLDVSKIKQPFIDGFSITPVAVGICKFSSEKKPNWTIDRWKSMGCKFKEVNCYKLG